MKLRAILAPTTLVVLLVGITSTAHPQTPAYQPLAAQHFGYELKAEADRGTHTDKLSGTIIYTVKSIASDKITLDWTSNVRKQESTRGVKGGPTPRLPFAALPSTAGQNGTLQINSQGEVISTQGSAHLPYLLGDLALLMIEPLPPAGREAWNSERSVNIAETGERLPGPPRPSQDPNRKRSAANETCNYKLVKRAADELVIEKQSELKTVEMVNGMPRLEITAREKWIFDTKRHTPQRLELNQTIVARAGNRTSVEIPIALHVEPLSDDELKLIEAERAERFELAKQKLREQQAKRAEPLDDEFRKALLADLRSGNAIKIQQALQKLSRRPAAKDDQALIGEIKALLDHKSISIRHAAADAWAKYSSEADSP